jgi:hypothetical protein
MNFDNIKYLKYDNSQQQQVDLSIRKAIDLSIAHDKLQELLTIKKWKIKNQNITGRKKPLLIPLSKSRSIRLIIMSKFYQ